MTDEEARCLWTHVITVTAILAILDVLIVGAGVTITGPHALDARVAAIGWLSSSLRHHHNRLTDTWEQTRT